MKKILFIPILLLSIACTSQVVDKSFGTRTYNVNTFQTRWTNGSDTLLSLYMDQLKAFKIINYSDNFGLSYTARTLTDKNYVDSAIAAAAGADGNGLYGGNGGAGGDGSLPGATTITGAGNTLTLTGTQSSNSAFNVNNTGNGGAGAFSTTGTGSALTGSNSSSGNGVLASSSSGNGLSATSTTGLAIRGKITPSSTTTIVHPFRTIRGTSGTAAAGLGGGWDMQLTDDAGNDVTAGVITPVWTSAATGATTSDIQIFTTNAGSSTLKATIKGNGQLRLHGYGAGTFTGTATEGAAFDANGNIIAAPLVAAAAYTPTITSGTNVASTTLQGADYQRIGDYVIVHLILLIDPTTTGATDIGISFPFASVISAGETKGTGNCRLVSGQNGTIIGDLANARAKFEYNATVATEEQFMIEFSYKITPP